MSAPTQRCWVRAAHSSGGTAEGHRQRRRQARHHRSNRELPRPRVSLSSDASVRRALGPLTDIAEDTGAAIVLVRHLNGQRRAPAYRRGLGGPAVANLARSVLVLALHQEDEGDPTGRRVLALTKGNLAGRSSLSVEFQLDTTGRLLMDPRSKLPRTSSWTSNPDRRRALAESSTRRLPSCATSSPAAK